MHMFDDDLPKPKKVLFTQADLTSLSVEELQTYIKQLDAEIARVQENIKSKDASRLAAEAAFK